MTPGRLASLNRPVVDFLARLPLRLELKLIAAFLVVVALLVLLGAAGLATLAETNRRTESLIETQQRSDEYRDLADRGHALLLAISSALWMPREQMAQLGAGVDALRGSLAKVRTLNGLDAGEVEAVRREYDKFIDIANREMALLRAGDIDLAGAVQTEQGQPEALKLREITDRLVDEAQAEAAGQASAARRAYHWARDLLLGFVIFAAAVGLYLAHTISGSVVGPLRAVGDRLAEIAGGDFTRRVGVANRDEIGTLADNVNRTSEQLGRLYADLEAEKARSEEMLYGILPRRIVERMRGGEAFIADRVADATVLFSDLAGFTELSSNLAPEEVLDVLDVLFSRFDTLADRLGLEKIKTIGDGYMVAAGVQHPRADHAAAIAEMALAMRAAADIATRALGVIGQPIRIRIGLHSGPLVAGVLGSNKLVYDVWGDTVNTASRMEKYGEPGRINVSAVTRNMLGGEFRFEARDPIEVKGKGEMQTFFLERHIGPRRFRNIVRRMTGAGA